MPTLRNSGPVHGVTDGLLWGLDVALRDVHVTLGHKVSAQRLDVDGLSDEALLQGIDRIFEITRRENPAFASEIGNPIDVVAIDQDGFSWLRAGPGHRM